LIASGAALAALALWAFAARASIDPSTGLPEADQGTVPPADDGSDWTEPNVVISNLPEATVSNPNQALAAFQYAVRCCEHTQAAVASGADYTEFYGGAQFSDLSDHPVATGEMHGVPLDALGPRYAGKVSTAAGAYQINLPTWQDVRQAGAWGPELPDFSPASQDEAARRLLMRCGALAKIDAGDIQGAFRSASAVWASLPYSTADQHARSMDFALARYSDGLQAG
jgi:muramidase (phage lysozyme)